MNYSNILKTENTQNANSNILTLKVTNIVYSCITFYLSIVLACYEVKVYKKNSGNRSTAQKNTKIKRVLCLLAAINGYVRFVLNTVLLYRPTISLLACRLLKLLSFTNNALASISVYAVLFLRHEELHKNDAIKHLRVFHGAAMFGRVIFVGYIIVQVVFISYFFLFMTFGFDKDHFCAVVASDIPLIIPPLTMMLGMSITDSVLVMMFVIPLFRHYLTSNARKETTKKFFLMIVRSLCITLVCVFTDIFSFVWVMVGFSKYANPLLLSTSLLVNVVTVLLLFMDWKERLFPWLSIFYKKARAPIRREPSTITRSTSKI